MCKMAAFVLKVIGISVRAVRYTHKYTAAFPFLDRANHLFFFHTFQQTLSKSGTVSLCICSSSVLGVFQSAERQSSDGEVQSSVSHSNALKTKQEAVGLEGMWTA